MGPPEGQDNTVLAVLAYVELLAGVSGYSASGPESIYDSFLLHHIIQALQNSTHGKFKSK